MKRRKIAAAAAFCVSFFLGTLLNLLFIPGFDPHQQRRGLGRSGGSSSELLRQQMKERYDEVVRYRQHWAPLPPARPLERRLMDLAGRRASRVPHKEEGAPMGYQLLHLPAPTASVVVTHALGCGDIANVTDIQYLGSGYTKAVFKAVLNRTLAVALKSVDFGGHDMDNCVRQYGTVEDCYRMASYKIVKEMTLLQRLQHPNILKLYGYCYQDNNDIANTLTTITELGSPLEMIQLLQTSWEERFRICLSLVHLLHYLAHSPLGSVALLDFRPRQFVIVDGELKVTDLDDATIDETLCSNDSDCFLEFPARNFTLTCSLEGRCQNLNEKRNLYNAYRFFFTYLLPHSAPPSLRPSLDTIVNATGELRWGIDETLVQLEKVLYLYKNGLYLQNSTNVNMSEYKQIHKATVQDENYRCWPSYHHEYCLLSVFDIREAISICENHSQCNAFILTNHKTWTGRQLVLFKTGSSQIMPDPDQIVYVKMAG